MGGGKERRWAHGKKMRWVEEKKRGGQNERGK